MWNNIDKSQKHASERNLTHESTYSMISFIWNSRTDKTNPR